MSKQDSVDRALELMQEATELAYEFKQRDSMSVNDVQRVYNGLGSLRQAWALALKAKKLADDEQD